MKRSPGQAAYEAQRIAMGHDDLSDDPWNTLMHEEDKDVWQQMAQMAMSQAGHTEWKDDE